MLPSVCAVATVQTDNVPTKIREEVVISRRSVYLASALTSVLLASAPSAFADCAFSPALPASIQTKCVKAIQIPGNPLRSFDISWVNPDRAEYYLGDRSNSGIDVIDTRTLTWKRTIGGFVGVVLNAAHTAVDNNHSGPDGVVSHGRWLYAGDGNSTLKVIDLDAPPAHALKNSIATGGTTRVDEMALTSNGRILIAANNAEDPPFATLFRANGDEDEDHTKILAHITVDPAIMPPNFGLSLEQPTWDPRTKRFFTSIPIIANNPTGCNYGQLAGAITCDGGVLVTDQDAIEDSFHGTVINVVQGAFNPATNTGVVPLHHCGPNGSSVGPHDNILLGCTPQNNPSDVIQLVINATTKAQTPILNITGSDEVWFNKGDGRYYTGSSRDCTVPNVACPLATQQTPVLGVIDAETNTLIEKVPQSSGSHSVAADSERNLIFVPQVAPLAVVGAGGDTTAVGAGICGTTNGCIAVYRHKVRDRDDDDDHDHDHDHDHGH
jgi:hypothetical protein